MARNAEIILTEFETECVLVLLAGYLSQHQDTSREHKALERAYAKVESAFEEAARL